MHQRQNANPHHSVFRESIICIYKHTNTLSLTHSFSFWRLQTTRTGLKFNVSVHFLHPSMSNIELTYRNSSCHLASAVGPHFVQADTRSGKINRKSLAAWEDGAGLRSTQSWDLRRAVSARWPQGTQSWLAWATGRTDQLRGWFTGFSLNASCELTPLSNDSLA